MKKWNDSCYRINSGRVENIDSCPHLSYRCWGMHQRIFLCRWQLEVVFEILLMEMAGTYYILSSLKKFAFNFSRVGRKTWVIVSQQNLIVIHLFLMFPVLIRKCFDRYYSSLEVASEYFRSGADKVSIGSDAVYAAEEYLKAKVPPLILWNLLIICIYLKLLLGFLLR